MGSRFGKGVRFRAVRFPSKNREPDYLHLEPVACFIFLIF